MNDESACFALRSLDFTAPAPVLVGVQVQGRLDAVLFELTLRQTYRNTGDRLLEVVYTFPLPPQAVLLGFASELNGRRQDGVIVARRAAEREYEASMRQGDAPVMLEAQTEGRHIANIGNLKPGDEIVLECRFAQLLRFEQGRLRLAIPTTFAPRYGDAARAGLQPQQVPAVSLQADHPLALSITIGEALAGAAVECPTHRSATRRGEDGKLQIELAGDSRLDRDVVVIVTPRESQPSLLVTAADRVDPSAPVVRLAALQPRTATPRERISLKLLVDCSGSMNGDSITSARAALRGIVANIGPGDRVSLSRFGGEVEHLLEPSAAEPPAQRRLAALVDGLQADLGGTEIERALNAVFRLPGNAEGPAADVLLITDGQVWQSAEVVAAARASGHRIFAIGVGTAPAEGMLRALAEATGGACEFATPGEALEAAARRMLQRMRQPFYAAARIDWGAEPAWATPLGTSLFGGDTVMALAGFAPSVRPGAVRLLAQDAQGQCVELARSEADAPCPGDSLPRMAASLRLATANATEALSLATSYQLLSWQTNCILVHQRSGDERAQEPAEMHRVASMLAAGWGGHGSVHAENVRFDEVPLEAMAFRMPDAAMAAFAPFHVSRRWAAPAFEGATLVDMARLVDAYVLRTGHSRGLGKSLKGMTLHPLAVVALDEVVGLGLSPSQAWLLLARWVNERSGGLADADLGARIRPFVEVIDPALAASAREVFERHLGACALEAWTPGASVPGAGWVRA